MNLKNMFNKNKPDAIAYLKGSSEYPNLNAKIEFYKYRNGTNIKIKVYNLPKNDNQNFFAIHIHDGKTCGSNVGESAFIDAKGHYNPSDEMHPHHAGDLPTLLSNKGFASMEVYTNRFLPKDIIGKTVVIHSRPDDYKSQPAGNSGKRIACGIIKKMQ